MREEHPDQHELPELPPGAPVVEQAAWLSEVAALSAKVIGDGLVREHRPVFVYDAKLAREKSGNAARQARLREKRAAQGLVMAQIPAGIADRLKAVKGDWSLLMGASSPPPNPGLVSPPGGDLTYVEVAKGLKAEIEASGGVQSWAQKKVDAAIAALPPMPEAKPKIIEKVVEKQVMKLTADQKKSFDLGVKMRSLKGWRARVLNLIL
jgi:hypothetical protein